MGRGRTVPAGRAPRSAQAAPPGELGIRGAVLVFTLALALRLLVLRDLAPLPLFRTPQLDQLEFLIWARGLLERGFSWPAVPTKGPGYAVFLALLLKLGGSSLGFVRITQAVLGAGTAVLTAALGARHFGRRAGVFAGALVALAGPLIFAELSLVAEGLLVALLAGALFAWSAVERPMPRALAVGLLLGAAILVRATSLALVIAFLILLLLGAGPLAPRLRAAAILLASCLVVALPVTLAMSRTTGSVLLVQGYGGLNLYMGNSPGKDGTPWARLGGEWNRLEAGAIAAGAKTAAEQDSYYLRATGAAIAADPAGWLSVLGKKLLWLLANEEIRDSHGIHFFREQSVLLSWLPGFGLILALAFGGALSLGRAALTERDLLAYLGAFALTCVAIIMGSRYRLPLLPALAAFAGVGLDRLLGALRAGERRRAAALALSAVGVFALSLLPRHLPSRNPAEEWALTGTALVSEHELAAAEAAYRQALTADATSGLAAAGLAALALDRGELATAKPLLERALRHQPDDVALLFESARLALAERRTADAESSLAKALALQPEDVPSLELLGPLLLARGETRDAEKLLRRALALKPASVEANLGLARLLGARREPGEGLAFAIRAAEASGNTRLDAVFAVAFLAIDAGRTDVARGALSRAEELAPGHPQVALGRSLLGGH